MLAGTVEERNKLATSIDADDTVVVCSYDIGGLRAGSVFEIDSELFYIWETNPAGKSLTVQRGYNGSTPTSHSSGAILTLNPRFPRSAMFDAVNSDLDDLSSSANGLFRVVSVDLEYNGADRQIDIANSGTILGILDVRFRYVTDEHPALRHYRLETGLPTADFPSGNTLVFDESVMASDVRVRYKAPFVRATSESSDLTTNCFLPATCDDIVEMGVILRMMAAREIKRNFVEAQGDTRRAEEVQSGAITSSIANILRLRRERIIAESGRLKAQYPIKFRK